MPCSSKLYAIPQDCSGSKGGVKRVWLAAYATDVFTTDKDTDTGLYKSVTGVNTETEFVQVNFRKGAANVESTYNIDNATGTNYCTNVLSMNFVRQEISKRISVAAMAVSEMAIVYEDANGNLFALGVEEGVMASGGSATTGAARTDANQYVMQLQDDFESFPLPLTASAAEAFLEAQG